MDSLEEMRRQLEQMQVRVQAAQERANAAEAKADVLRAAAAAAEAKADVLRTAAAAAAGGNSGTEDAALLSIDSIPAELVFPKIPVKSPTCDNAICFLEDPFVALIHEPVTLTVDPSLSRAFAALLLTAGSAQRMGQERTFYELATTYLPNFVQAVGQPSGDMSAGALFSASALATPVWSLPSGCKPELHARAAAVGYCGGSGGVSLLPELCPAFNGELKSAGDGRALEQAALYTVMDLLRVFFPAEPANNSVAASNKAAKSAASCQRLFYSRPPLGYALVAYPYMAQVMVVECLGKMLMSPFSQPFLLGSEQHVNVMATLPQPHFEAPLVLNLSTLLSWRTAPGARAELTSWCTDSGVFRKLVRGDARSGAGFAAMHAAYKRLSDVLPRAPPSLHLPTSLRLLFGLHCVLVELEPVVVGRMAREELELRQADSPLLLSVARSIAWLASHCVIYTDLRAPNVIVDDEDGEAWLVDFDDCVVVEEAVCSVSAFKKAVSLCPGAGEVGTFAANLCAGAEGAFEAALGKAFDDIPEDVGTSLAGT